MIEHSRGLARRHKLADDDGVIWCFHCGTREALLPSLACPPCLAEAWRRRGIVSPWCMNRAQTDEDRDLMKKLLRVA